jgi:NADP-dependent 3-hydroxy acid dehydrogenase YdfG
MTPQRVLITGASSGIGAALARLYRQRQAQVIIVARRQELLHELAQAIGAVPFVGNVNDPQFMQNVATYAQQTWGGLDVVITNAGYALVAPLDQLNVGDYRHQFETNVFGTLITIEHCLPLLITSRGRLVITGSVAASVATPESTPYAMSKAALRPLAAGLHASLAAQGVSVTLLTPGLIDTHIRQRNRQGDYDPTSLHQAPSWLVIPADQAARQMVRAIDRRQREAVITWHAWWLLLAWRLCPWLVRPWFGKRTS